MGNPAIRYLQVGVQTGTTDTPASFAFIDIQGELSLNDDVQKVPVNVQHDDGEKSNGDVGPRKGDLSFQTLLRGKGGGALDSLDGVIGADLDALFYGLCGVRSVSSGLTSGASHTTTRINIGVTGGFGVGDMVMIYTSGGYQARQIVAISTDSYIQVYPALSAAPANGSVAMGAITYHANAADLEHPHLYLKAEGQDFRRDFLGCAVKASLDVTPGGILLLKWDVMASHWENEAAESPTYAASSSKAGLSLIGSPFYLAGVETELVKASVEFGYNPTPKTASSGPNGANGFVHQYDGLKLSGTVYYTEALMAAFQAKTPQHCFLQLGDVSSDDRPGNTAALAVPALGNITAKRSTANGLEAIDFSGEATRSNTTVPQSFSFGVFGGES
jgi:hypothetical protein